MKAQLETRGHLLVDSHSNLWGQLPGPQLLLLTGMQLAGEGTPLRRRLQPVCGKRHSEEEDGFCALASPKFKTFAMWTTCSHFAARV